MPRAPTTAAVAGATPKLKSSAARTAKLASSKLLASPADSGPTFDLERVPLQGREAEFEAVVAFVSARLRREHGRALFVFGACGCGKTSTVLRAMRSFHNRPLPCDHQVRNRDEPRAALTLNSSSFTCSPAKGAAKRGRSASTRKPTEEQNGRKGRRLTQGDGDSPASSSSSTRPSAGGDDMSNVEDSPNSAGHRSSRTSATLLMQQTGTSLAKELFNADGGGDASSHTMQYFHSRYPDLYTAVAGDSPVTTKAPAQAHYINCADQAPEQFVAAIHDSMKLAYPRPTAALTMLLSSIAALPERCKKSRKADGGGGGAAAVIATPERGGTATFQQPLAAALPLQVLVLDEVEYVRPATRALLTELAAMSFHPSSRLALVCISNQRDLVHVPLTLLEELAFASYSVQQLKQIGMSVVEREIEKRLAALSEEAAAAAATAAATSAATRTSGRGRKSHELAPAPAVAVLGTVTISPSLYEYVARKTLSEYSGDVRQMTAMCRRVVYTACEQWLAKQTSSAAETKKTLEAAVDAYCGEGVPDNHTQRAKTAGPLTSSHRGSTSTSVRTTALSAQDAGKKQPSNVESNPARCTVTLANSINVIKGAGVEDHLRAHMGTMPEQSLYLLSCLVTLSRKRERDRHSARVAIGGRPTGGNGGSSVVGSTAMTLREAHGLYMRLMSRRYYPPMNGAGVATTLSYLADLGIITRPQTCGNEEKFSFSGSCSLEALEMAVVERGEEQRKEREAAGLDGSDNQLAAILRELSTLAGLSF